VRDALATIGYAGKSGPSHAIGARFEAHIEQGSLLNEGAQQRHRCRTGCARPALV
jgi:hypothetical protein